MRSSQVSLKQATLPTRNVEISVVTGSRKISAENIRMRRTRRTQIIPAAQYLGMAASAVARNLRRRSTAKVSHLFGVTMPLAASAAAVTEPPQPRSLVVPLPLQLTDIDPAQK